MIVTINNLERNTPAVISAYNEMVAAQALEGV